MRLLGFQLLVFFSKGLGFFVEAVLGGPGLGGLGRVAWQCWEVGEGAGGQGRAGWDFRVQGFRVWVRVNGLLFDTFCVSDPSSALCREKHLRPLGLKVPKP